MTAETVQRPDSTGTAACTAAQHMTIREAAAMIGRSKEYLYAGLRSGRFPGAKFGRSRMMPRAFMEGFVVDVLNPGRPVSFEEYAKQWLAKAEQGAA